MARIGLQRFPNPYDLLTFVEHIADINGISGCINLQTLNLNFCQSLAGLFCCHHLPFYF